MVRHVDKIRSNVLGIVPILFTVIIGAHVASAQPGRPAPANPQLVSSAHQDTSPPLRHIHVPPAKAFPVFPDEVPRHFPGRGNRSRTLQPDPVRQSSAAPTGAQLTPAPGMGFDGLNDDDNATLLSRRVVPPDTQGDVGPNHYVQMINLVWAVYDKNTGAKIYGPVPNNILWTGFGGPCETNNNGDPIVLYDHLADRWFFSQLALDGTGHQCIAVSTTPDPTGPYYRYDFEVSQGINDYPKFGIWPDAYYMTANEFDASGTSYLGPMAIAFNRSEMLAGVNPATGVKFGQIGFFCLFECFYSLQPSNLEGPPPPSGTPNTIAMAFDDQTWGTGSNPDGYRLWYFKVNWSSPLQSTLTALPQIDTAPFDANLCGFGPCVPQPAPGELLSTLGQFTMYRAQYRNFGDHQTLVLNHTVNPGNNIAGIRWVELRKTTGSWFLYQTGTFAPNDGLSRWMGSIAMDGAGNIALGYSVSGPSTFPSIRYITRSASDPLGTLSGGEVTLVDGTDVQTNSANRWGDYSTMSVDPADNCTFWYTQEYQSADGDLQQDRDFKTRIGSFKLDSCVAPSPVTDIAIAQVSALTPVGQGSPVNVAVTVQNVGNQPVSSDINVSLTETPDNTAFVNQVIAGGLAPGASQTVNFSWQTNSSTALGDHVLTATHDIADGNAANNSRTTTVKVNAPVTVTSISPNTVRSGTTVPVVVTGTGFVAGAQVTFENGAGPTPTMTVTSVTGTQIRGSVTSRRVQRNRTWDVRVTNPDGSTAALPRAFTITP